MMEITLHVSITKVPDDYFEDGRYESTRDYITEKLQEIAEGVEGCLYDYEIK